MIRCFGSGRRWEWALVVVGCCLPMMALAQQSASVSGHVTCGDTQRPARFALVALMGVPKAAAEATVSETAHRRAVMENFNEAQTQTTLDGSYVVSNVAPGDYYVFAWVPGYLTPKAIVEAAMNAGADLTKAIPGVPIVHVAAEGSASADITVERGAALTGRVLWDDGSPAPWASVEVVSAKGAADLKKLPPGFSMLFTAMNPDVRCDDLGQFRLSGLAAGEYIVKATMTVHSSHAIQHGVMNLATMLTDRPLVAYAPNAFHRADAKPLTLVEGQEVSGEDIVINLAGTHAVSGRVESAEDGHGLNAGAVTLTDASDGDAVRGSGVDAAGNFTVGFVPPGTYSLTVSGAADTELPKSRAADTVVRYLTPVTVRSYEAGKLSVTVGSTDVAGLNVALQPSKTSKQD